MSMDFNMSAKIEAKDKKGKTHTICKRFNLWQTPTEVSYEIMKQEDKLAAYCNWVIKSDKLDTIEKYLGTPEEILEKEYNWACPDYLAYYSAGHEHITKLRKAIDEYLEEGYELEFYVQ